MNYFLYLNYSYSTKNIYKSISIFYEKSNVITFPLNNFSKSSKLIPTFNSNSPPPSQKYLGVKLAKSSGNNMLNLQSKNN